MSTLKTPSPDVLEYLQAVRATLADLPAEERDELMVDVESALFEAAEESEGPLAARLGPPEEFAADLRAAAGLQAAQAPAPPASRLRDVLAAVLEHPRVVGARRTGGELAPIWWVARGFIAFALLALMLGAGTSVRHPWMPVVGNRAMTFVVLALFVAGSVWLGLRHRGGDSRALVAANVTLAVLALPLGLYLSGKTSPYSLGVTQVVYAVQPGSAGLNVGGRHISNLYPYTRDGRLLHDVLLYDDQGLPVTIGEQANDANRRVLTTRSGQQIFNSFPALYFDPGTRRVADPDATAAPIRVPAINKPPPLRGP